MNEPMRLAILAGLVLLVVACFGTAVQAQTGQPFVEHQSWYTDDLGLGILPDGLGNLTVEFDGVPGISAADHTHPVPPEADQGLSPFRNYNLSPTRRFLTVTGASSSGLGTRMYLYRVPQVDGAPFEYIAGGLTLTNGLAFQGFFDYDVPGLPSIYFAVEISGVAQTQRIYWLNLDSGIASFSNDIPASVQWPVTFSPNGIAAFIQHDGNAAGQRTYRLVELCDDDLGSFLNQTGAPFDNLPSPLASAYLAGSAGTGYVAEVIRGGSALGVVPLDDCVTAVPPAVGACCQDGNCLPGTTQSVCEDGGGVWQGAGSDCVGANCPPPVVAHLTLTGSGPSQASTLGPVPYTFLVANTGNAPALLTTLTASVPQGAVYESSSLGGVYDSLLKTVTWSLGTVNAGASLAPTLSVRASCGVVQIVQFGYQVTASAVLPAFGNPISTSLNQPSGSPVVSVTAAASAVPLATDDTLVYTFDLLNTGGEQPGVTFSGLYGDFVDFDGVVNAGGGVWSHNGAGFTWTGDLPDGAPRQVAVRVRLKGCRGPNPLSTTLNFGNPITIYGGCSDILASLLPPAATEIQPPDLHTSVTVTPPVAPRIYNQDHFVVPVLARPGVDLPVQWLLVNQGASQQTISLGQCLLNGMAPAADPPFVGTPPAGVTWDGPGNRILFAGSLAPGDTLRVNFAAHVPANADCRQRIDAVIATDDCGQAASGSAPIAGVETEWQGSHLVMANSFGEVHRVWPDLGQEPEPWFCLTAEYISSFSRTESGALWMVGLPNYRVDPETLELWTFGYGFFGQVGMTSIWHVVENEAGQVYFSGGVASGPDILLSVVRWDPATESSVLVWQEQTGAVGDISGIGAMKLSPDGVLSLTTPEGLIRMDIGDPAAAVIWSDPVMTMGYHNLAQYGAGPYLVSDPVWNPQVEALVAIDPTTGAHTVAVPNLNSGPHIDAVPYVAMAADSQGRVFLAPSFGKLSRVDLTDTSPVVVPITAQDQGFVGLVWVQMGAPSGVANDLPATPRAVALYPATPNPFNPRTTLSFDLPRDGRAQLTLYDLRGRKVVTLVDRHLTAGAHRAVWQGTDDHGRSAPSGVYLARLSVWRM